MRRADRLFQLVQLLRARRLTTAADLARELDVSTRTVYRDVQDLLDSGIPIEGEAGVGYRLQKGFELKPMTFTVEQLQALVLGARMVQAWADPELGAAVRGAISKIEAILPEPLQQSLLKTALFGPPYQFSAAPPHLLKVRQAITHERWIRLSYVSEQAERTERAVVPLGLYFWGRQWLLAAYCCLREDYRNFRVDRVQSLELFEPGLEQKNALPPGISLEGYIAQMEGRTGCR